MIRKYTSLFLLVLIVFDAQGQYSIFRTFGADTTIYALDASSFNPDDLNPQMWIGTNKGLLNLNPGATTIYDTINSPLPSHSISCLDYDPASNTVWIGTDKGFCWIDSQGNWSCFTADNSILPSDSITCVQYTDMYGPWIGTTKGLVNYNIYYQNFTLYDTQKIQCLEWVDQYQHFLIGTAHGLFIDFNLVDTTNSGLTSNDVRSISKGSSWPDTNVWIATYGGGICHWEDNVWESFTTSNNSTRIDSFDFVEYSYGSGQFIYAGNRSDSMYIYNDNYFGPKDFLTAENQFDSVVVCVSVPASHGAVVWLATQHTIFTFDNEEGISEISYSIQWQANISANTLHLFNLPASGKKLDLKIYDVLGNTLLWEQFFNHQSNPISFDIPELFKAVYFVEVEFSDRTECVKVIMTE